MIWTLRETNQFSMKKKAGTKRKGKLTDLQKKARRLNYQRAYRKKVKEKKKVELKQQEIHNNIFERLVTITSKADLPPVGEKVALIIDKHGRLKFWAMNKAGLFRPVAIFPRDVISFGFRHDPELDEDGGFKNWKQVGFIKTAEVEYPITKYQVDDYLKILRNAKVKLNTEQIQIVGIRPANRTEVRRYNKIYTYELTHPHQR